MIVSPGMFFCGWQAQAGIRVAPAFEVPGIRSIQPARSRGSCIAAAEGPVLAAKALFSRAETGMMNATR
jgi:hypothetical protein